MPSPDAPPISATSNPSDPTKGQRAGVALCLSGGGFRAALFHLGALRRLNECGLLGWLDRIVSVSGGSITAAHLARRVSPWPELGKVFPDWEAKVAAPLRAFCRIDIRTPAVWQGLKHPIRTWRAGGVPSSVLQEAVHRFIHDGPLTDLPNRPQFVIQATDVDHATLFRFERNRIVHRGKDHDVRPTDTVARAVTASACFPPIFAPISADDHDPKRFTRDDRKPGLVPLSDGGLYDNLGLQPVIQRFQHILISDAGAPFDYSVRARGLGALIGRYPAVLMRQLQVLRMREWISLRDNEWIAPNRRISGAWWSLGITKHPAESEALPIPVGPRPVGYPEDFLADYVVKCRTDLNTFTATEAGVLENAGYMNCAIALHDRIPPPAGIPPFPPATWPHPELADADHVKRSLFDIDNRLPGGLLPFLWHMLRDHKLPATLPVT